MMKLWIAPKKICECKESRRQKNKRPKHSRIRGWSYCGENPDAEP